MILTSKRHTEHAFAGQNTQHLLLKSTLELIVAVGRYENKVVLFSSKTCLKLVDNIHSTRTLKSTYLLFISSFVKVLVFAGDTWHKMNFLHYATTQTEFVEFLLATKFRQIGVPTRDLFLSRVLKVCNLGRVEAPYWKPKIVLSRSTNTSPIRTC